ncbi:hypothetical protein Q427_26910 [Halomonas sp. BC04]|nr:hypothetical protein Q427_26910 [Halomonas sp. BC04]
MMVNLANAFAREGFKVALVVCCADGPYRKEVAQAVEVVDLATPRVFQALPALVKYLRRSRPKVMLSTLTHANVVAGMALLLARVDCRCSCAKPM